MTDDVTEFWSERAAVREFDGGFLRDDAEALALGDVAIKYGWPTAVELAEDKQHERNREP